MTNIIKNFELVENKQGLVITYPIEESNALKNIDEVNAKVVKNDKNYYDILILSLDGLEKTIFENLDRDLLEKLENKNVRSFLIMFNINEALSCSKFKTLSLD